METKEREYTVKEIAFMEGVSARTVYRWCEKGFLQCYQRPGMRGRRFIRITDYEYFKKKI